MRHTIPARPTIYRGIPMRSRLEAKVAAALDRMGADWEYEPAAYADCGYQYLPDFVLHGVTIIRDAHPRHAPNSDVVVEVRPTYRAADATGEHDAHIVAASTAAPLVTFGYYDDQLLWGTCWLPTPHPAVLDAPPHRSDGAHLFLGATAAGYMVGYETAIARTVP